MVGGAAVAVRTREVYAPDVSGRDSSALYAVIGLLAVALVACTVLVALDKLDGDVFVGVVIGPVIGGGIAFVAGTKGVQQGSQASTSPPPTA